MSRNDPFDPIIVPHQGNPEGTQPPSSGAVRIQFRNLLLRFLIKMMNLLVDGLPVLPGRVGGFEGM